MAHIPKRATQHGIHLCGPETLPPALKPGQAELLRQELYAQEAKPFLEPYLFQDQFSDSHYTTSIARITLPEDYTDPTQMCKPPTVTCGEVAGGTQHWKSEYRANMNEGCSEEAEFGRPYIPRIDQGEPPILRGRGNLGSAYQEDFGRYRENPRDRIGKNIKRPMDAGTAKGTLHIPGYQGFIPGNTFSEGVARIERGDFSRSVDKTNVEQTFHTNIIGYSGHQPKSAVNDNGGRQPSNRTVYDHDFPHPQHHQLKQKDDADFVDQAKLDRDVARLAKLRT